MNGLTKGKYVELKKVNQLKDTVIAQKYKINPTQLIEWKKVTFTPDELKALNLPKRVQKVDVTKTIQAEEKPQKTEIKKNQTQEKTIAYLKSELQKEQERHTNSIKKLNEDAERGVARYERAIKDLKEKLELEQEAKKRMAAAHQTNIQKFIDEKELAYMKANDEKMKYLDTLEKLKKTDYELQNVNQRIKELESERDQLKLDFEKATALLNPLIKVIKIAL
ncbi:hypothetical protein [Heyndrickxia camelliae]|uniref:Uncharacterized protein n=1 Tax=Heyndrickxia camelliae TaxID=1707093 RepID=A0A2N3LNB1_9BACI|nr:hypothetical protein [Heyndrickxia camelliae]PKR86121.1 hypothetical protein CWO92_07040 [Heyndrickxia camelliae]